MHVVVDLEEGLEVAAWCETFSSQFDHLRDNWTATSAPVHGKGDDEVARVILHQVLVMGELMAFATRTTGRPVPRNNCGQGRMVGTKTVVPGGGDSG